MFVLDRSRHARIRKVPAALAAVTSFALLAGLLQSSRPAAAIPAAAPQPPAAKVASRPDVISASVTARAQGTRVEVESMRTETSTTWSNPDGTMTTDAHATPIRFKTAKGAWQSINLTLQKAADGTVAPRGHEHGLRLGKRNAATGQVFASASSGTGRQVEWLSPWKLPEPTLDGTKATYAEVQPGVDLVLDARRSGFENDFIVKQRPATAPVWRIPLRTKGLTPRTAADGSIEFVDAKNVVRSKIPVGFMWDAAGDQANKTVVKVTVEQISRGKATLVIAPDAKWFLDPSRVFPVTVDPAYVTESVLSSFDTYVSTSLDADVSSTVDLRIGKEGTHQERTFFNFPTAAFVGKDIVDSYLSLYQTNATTCTPTTVNLYSADVSSTKTRWAAQPSISTTVSGTATVSKGFSSACAAGRIGINMTGLARTWAAAPATTAGVALKAASESDPAYWKKFGSAESMTDPFVSFTWNRPPGTPLTAVPTEAVPYAAPGETASSLYSPTLRPWVQTRATDPDGGTLKYVFEFYTGAGSTLSVKGTCITPVVASATTAKCQPTSDLPDNTLLYIRVKANDGRVDGPWVNYNQRLRTGAAAPAQPVVSCPTPYVINSWQDNAPTADVVCTVTAIGTGYAAPGYIRLTVDGMTVPTNFTGGAAGQLKITPSSDPAVAKTTVTLPKDVAGLHRITAQAETPAGRTASASYSFGWGGSSLISPAADPRTTTTGVVKIAASGPPRGQSAVPTAKVRWRLSGYAGDGQHDTVGWNDATSADVTVTDLGAAGVSAAGRWDTSEETVDAKLDDPATPAVDGTTLNPALPALLDVQVCLTYASSTQCTWSETKTTVLRVPHAFGDGFPTADAEVGELALWTGEFSASGTDISVPGAAGSLTVARTHSTYAGAPTETNAIFGPGWSAQFDGPDSGAAGVRVVDSTRTDGTIALIDADQNVRVYAAPDGKRRTSAQLLAGTWVAANEATKLAAARLVVSGTGAATVLTYTEDVGFQTKFVLAAPMTATTNAVFVPEEVTELERNQSSRFIYDPARPARPARLVRIVAPAPDGVVCVTAQSTFTRNRGCRSLQLEYGPVTAGGDRLIGVTLDTYNPQKAGGAAMDSIAVAAYGYDDHGRLASVMDPRSGLRTQYGYDDQDLLTSITPPGQTPYQLSYVVADGRPKLAAVKRERPSGGLAVLKSYVYGVPVSGPGLPDVSAASVARWGQTVTPTTGFAEFGAEHPVNSTDPTAISADDWQYASLQYSAADGSPLNTADFGAGAWQYTAVDEDSHGNSVRSLDQRAIRKIIDGAAEPTTADLLSTTTVYNQDIVDTAGQVLTPAGSRPTDVFYPVRQAVAGEGPARPLRLHSKTKYDELAPNAGINPDTSLPYGMETSATKSAFDPGTGQDVTLDRTLTDYAMTNADGETGWEAGLPGQVVTDTDLDGQVGSGDIRTVTKYDADGRVVEDRQPKAADSANDAGVKKTLFYTSAANAQTPECGGKPEWEGMTCKTLPAAVPVTSTGTATKTLPTTTVLGYSYLLNPTVTVEKSGSVTRTTTSTYSLDSRPTGERTTVTGLASSTPNTAKSTSYDPLTGLSIATTATAADGTSTSIRTGYDSWGRETSYQQDGEGATTTAYDEAGNVSVVSDPNGSTSYTYDGTDARGLSERRGVVTKVETRTPGRVWSSTGAYDAAGSLVFQKLPGGLTREVEVNAVGEALSLRYGGKVVSTDENGQQQVNPDGTWLSWAQDRDAGGRVVREWTPEGTAFSTGGAMGYDRSLSYDGAGRLVSVQDRTGSQAGCVTRSYAFDADSNRTAEVRRPGAADGSCATTGGSATTRDYDTADRPVSGGNGQGTYGYDELGRTLRVPAADTPKPAAGDLSLQYYDNDLARASTQNGTTSQYTLDPLDRRALETVTTAAGSTQVLRHYTDGGDDPTWISTGSTTERYAPVVSGQWGLTVNGSGTAEVVMTNLHGDVVTTAALPDDQTAASSIEGWSSYEEYGQRSTAFASTGVIDHGWLGGSQRATSDAGLILMGVRLYNPATGLFTSQDPMPGGGATALSYCSADPVNCTDTTGLYDFSLKYDLGRYKYSSRYFFNRILRCFTCYFPIKGAKTPRLGVKMDLRPYKMYFPVVVSKFWGSAPSSGWRFNTRFGHPDYPGWIQFTFYKIGGYTTRSHIWLEVYGRVLGAGAQIPKKAYLKVSRRTWNGFAAKLRALVVSCRCGGRSGPGGGGGGGSW